MSTKAEKCQLVKNTYNSVNRDFKGANSRDDLVVRDGLILVGNQLAVDVAHGPEFGDEVINNC